VDATRYKLTQEEFLKIYQTERSRGRHIWGRVRTLKGVGPLMYMLPRHRGVLAMRINPRTRKLELRDVTPAEIGDIQIKGTPPPGPVPKETNHAGTYDSGRNPDNEQGRDREDPEVPGS
jgi:hypothetical protein